MHYYRFFLILVLLFFPVFVFGQNAGSPFGSSSENPGISVVGEVTAIYDEGADDWLAGLSNFELSLQAPIDPFGRADFTLHYHTGLLEHEGEEHAHDAHDHGSGGFEIEEALITLTALPMGFQLSGGRLRSKIGFVNVLHLHDFNFLNYPHILTDYFGEEGLSVDGLRLSWLAPLPFWTEFVLEGQKRINEDEGEYVTAGLNIFAPIGDDMGVSFTSFGYYDRPIHEHGDDEEEMEGEEHENDWDLNGYGVGLRFKWKPLDRALYTHVILQTEYMNRRFDERDYDGFYLLAEYLFARKWTFGLMYQDLETLESHEMEDENDHDHNDMQSESTISAAVSYYLSEFQRLRFQFDAPIDDEEEESLFSLCWTIILGPHQPHSY